MRKDIDGRELIVGNAQALIGLEGTSGIASRWLLMLVAVHPPLNLLPGNCRYQWTPLHA